jgi:DNA-binding MarR family transcriptional regulator
MTPPRTHPRHVLDEVIHAPVRLSIVATLASAEKVDFRFLRDTLEVSDSLLSKHLTTLETAGYVEITKGHLGRRPRTWCSLTETGQKAFRTYTAVLQQIVAGDNRSTPGRHDGRDPLG